MLVTCEISHLIVGTYNRSQRIEYIEENFSASQLKLAPEELKALQQLVNETEISGAQYPPYLQAMLYADTPELPKA